MLKTSGVVNLKSAVMYYSRTEKTAEAAKALANKISGDLIEIKDLKNRKGILNYIRAAFDAIGSKLAHIEPDNVNTDGYNILCFGTPVWAGKPAPAFNTLLQNIDISGKDIILFVTLGGANYKGALNLMSKMVKDKSGNIIKTFAITHSGKKDAEQIENEINRIEFSF